MLTELGKMGTVTEEEEPEDGTVVTVRDTDVGPTVTESVTVSVSVSVAIEEIVETVGMGRETIGVLRALMSIILYGMRRRRARRVRTSRRCLKTRWALR